MINFSNTDSGFGLEISDIHTCNFDQMQRLSNQDILKNSNLADNGKIADFIETKMGVKTRYHAPEWMTAYDLARQALAALVKSSPDIVATADFLIYAGISNPYPVSTISAMLANEFNFFQPSCWDIKSGCSSGVLALIQASAWLNMGAKRGVIICSETLSKFAPKDVLQMSASVGDGAVAMVVESSNKWLIKGIVHGTEPCHINDMAVKAKFPLANELYEREDVRFTFQEKGKGIKRLSEIWVESLLKLLQQSNLGAQKVNYYVPHQVDATKNAQVAQICGIPEQAVAKNFLHYGNMGSPTVFINYYQLLQQKKINLIPGEHLIFQAVGGGISWAGICLEYLG